jgi:hypothetical protein
MFLVLELLGEKREGRRLRREKEEEEPARAASCSRYSRGTNSSKRRRVDPVLGSLGLSLMIGCAAEDDEDVERVSLLGPDVCWGSDLNST